MIECYIETEGPDKGRVKDIDIAMDLAFTVAAWLEEGDGKPMLTPSERPGKPEIHFRDIVNEELKKLIMAKVTGEINLGFDAIYNTPSARANDPESTDPHWAAYRAAQ